MYNVNKSKKESYSFVLRYRYIFSSCSYHIIYGKVYNWKNSRAARYSKINLDIVLSRLNIQDNNRYNIYIRFSIQYQDCGVKNLVLS